MRCALLVLAGCAPRQVQVRQHAGPWLPTVRRVSARGELCRLATTSLRSFHTPSRQLAQDKLDHKKPARDKLDTIHYTKMGLERDGVGVLPLPPQVQCFLDLAASSSVLLTQRILTIDPLTCPLTACTWLYCRSPLHVCGWLCLRVPRSLVSFR